MNRLPDFDIELSQTISFIMECPLARRAFIAPPFPSYANIVLELVEQLDRLADNCHMPEFTNHALPHVCSVVARTCTWAVADNWLEQITSREAGYLLIALIIHDIGMLSQDPRDMPDTQLISSRKGMSDLPMWVRRSHVSRLPKLIHRILPHYMSNDEIKSHMDIIIQIAASHSYWPWDERFNHIPEKALPMDLNLNRLRGLNAVVAVADLLDEDSGRCDTATLLRHKHGNILNITHWVRHALTAQVEEIKNRTIKIHFRKFPDAPQNFDIVYRVLRNHYRLVLFYVDDLEHINAALNPIVFIHQQPSQMIEDDISAQMSLWKEQIDLKYCLIQRLLGTFEPAAKNIDGGDKIMRQRLNRIGMESIDLSPYDDFLCPKLPRTDEERMLLRVLQ